MYTTPTMATRFARNTFVIRSETPLAEGQMRMHARGGSRFALAGVAGSRSRTSAIEACGSGRSSRGTLGRYFPALRVASTSTACVLLRPLSAAMAARWPARGRALPASQL